MGRKWLYAPARLAGSRDAHSHILVAGGVILAFAVSSWKTNRAKAYSGEGGVEVECSCSEDPSER